jgi:hypothetical protein
MKHTIPNRAPKPSCASCRYPPSLKVDGNSCTYVPVKLDWKCGEYAVKDKVNHAV